MSEPDAWLFVGGYEDDGEWWAPLDPIAHAYTDRNVVQMLADHWTDHKGREGRVFPLYRDPEPDDREGLVEALDEIEVDAASIVNLPHEAHKMELNEVLDAAVTGAEDILENVDRLRDRLQAQEAGDGK